MEGFLLLGGTARLLVLVSLDMIVRQAKVKLSSALKGKSSSSSSAGRLPVLDFLLRQEYKFEKVVRGGVQPSVGSRGVEYNEWVQRSGA